MGKTFLYGRSIGKNTDAPFAQLTVHCPAYSVVRVESEQTSAMFETTSDASGTAVFSRLTEGDWNITFVGMENAPSQRITIDSLDYEITLSFFTATLNITYPAGGICHVSSGSYHFTAPNTSGTWQFVVPNAGNWSVEVVYPDLNNASVSKTVTVNSAGQTTAVSFQRVTANVNITYPAGARCTVGEGDLVMSAPNTSGTWNAQISIPSEWLPFTIPIKAVSEDGQRNDFDTVNITGSGQTANVTLKFFEAYLNVTYPVGATCTINTEGQIIRAPDTSGTFSIDIWRPTSGIVVSCVSGSNTDSKTVDITYDGQVVNVSLSLFEAYINVTYPAGSTCTCTNGGTVLTDPGISGTYTFVVPNAGSWVVSCTDGNQTASATVTIATSGENKSTELKYRLNLYSSGSDNTAVTGGWETGTTGGTYTKFTVTSNTITSSYNGQLPGWGWVSTRNAINVTEYSKITVLASVSDFSADGEYYLTLYDTDDEVIMQQNGPLAKSEVILTLDVSTLSGDYYPTIEASQVAMTVRRVYLE